MGDFFRMPIATRMEVVGFIDGNKNAGNIATQPSAAAGTDAGRQIQSDARGMGTSTGQSAGEHLATRNDRIPKGRPAAVAKLASTTAKNDTKPAETLDPFAGNKLFTSDKVAAARARMKSKLGRLNSGLDPELLIDGMIVAGAYIESGVRSFTDYAKTMVDDMGDGVKPFLLSFWEGARNYPGLDTTGMTSTEDSATQHKAMLAAEKTGEADAQAAKLVDNPNAEQATSNQKQGSQDVPDTNARVERDSQGTATKPAVGNTVSPDTGGAASTTGKASGRANRGDGRGQLDSPSVPFGSAPVAGDRGDKRLHTGEPVPELEGILAGDKFGERSGDDSVGGVPVDSIPASQVDATTTPRTDPVKAGIERARANKAPVKLADLQSIKATLPQLYLGQQEDVLKTEKRFADPKGCQQLTKI